MPLLVFLLFLLPFLEIYVLIAVGGMIGVVPTILLMLGLSVFGAYILSRQGLRALIEVQRLLVRGQMPVDAMLDGVGLTLAGVLLVVPGLITDVFGFGLLIPQARRWLMRRALGLLVGEKVSHTVKQSHQSKSASGANTVIEGEFRRLDE